MRFRLKQKHGKHSMVIDGVRRKLVPGDTIDCESYELGNALDKFEQLDPTPPPKQPKVGLRIVESEISGLFDVINESSGRALNDEPLDEDAARSLVEVEKMRVEV